MAATLRDVALRAGVSIPTANHILIGRGERYATETCAKVQAAAKALDYRSDIAARGMREGKTYLIGVLFNGVNYVQITDFLAGLQRATAEHSYVSIFMSHDSLEVEKANADMLLNRRVDGLIVTPWVESNGEYGADFYEELRKQKIPMVEVFSRLLPGVPKVNIDNVAAGRLAVRQLVAHGHQRIAYIITQPSIKLAESNTRFRWHSTDFTRGYEAELHAHSLTPIPVVRSMERDLLHPGSIYGQAFEMAPRLFQLPSRPTAVICDTIEEADGVIHYGWRHPELVPEGFEIATIGSSYKETQSIPPIHYVHWSAEEVGQAAAKSLLTLLKKEPVGDVLIAPTWRSASSTHSAQKNPQLV